MKRERVSSKNNSFEQEKKDVDVKQCSHIDSILSPEFNQSIFFFIYKQQRAEREAGEGSTWHKT